MFTFFFSFSRFYNRAGDGKLNFSEFCSLIRDVRVSKGFSSEPSEVEKEAKISAK